MDTTRTEGSLFETDGFDGARTIWWLSVAHHADAGVVGLRAPVPPGTRLVLGREEGHFGKGGLADGRISRKHAVVRCDSDGVLQVRDRDSRNGTFVNGERISSTELEPGDVIGVGSILLLCHKAPIAFEAPDHPRLVGRSWALGRLLDGVEQIARHDTPVLVLGETGTGKELVARELHRSSGRRGKLESVNCGAVTENLLQSELFGHVRGAFSGADRDRAGLLEEADGGTAFLDEIGEASPALQVALLRFLQEGELRRVGSNRTTRVDTRVVAATHRDLLDRVDAGDFREDLYARLAGWVVEIPPLRERKEDIPLLVRHFAKGRSVRHRLMRRLLAWHWPRNVRELESVVRRASIQAPAGEALGLTEEIDAMLRARGADPDTSQAEASAPKERPTPEQLEALIRQLGCEMKRVARSLNVSRNTLYRWVKEDGIDLAALRASSGDG